MPIQNKRWSTATKDHVRDIVPERPGVYELKCFGKLVYIGKADNLRRRMLEHLNTKNPNKFRYETVTGWFSSPKGREDELLDRYEEKQGKLPPWNKNDTRR
jgi:hypothetical protein